MLGLSRVLLFAGLAWPGPVSAQKQQACQAHVEHLASITVQHDIISTWAIRHDAGPDAYGLVFFNYKITWTDAQRNLHSWDGAFTQLMKGAGGQFTTKDFQNPEPTAIVSVEFRNISCVRR